MSKMGRVQTRSVPERYRAPEGLPKDREGAALRARLFGATVPPVPAAVPWRVRHEHPWLEAP